MLYKKELLKIPSVKPDIPCNIKKDTSYIGAAQVADSGRCGKVYNLDVYENKKEKTLLTRFFSDGKTFCIYRAADGKWMCTKLRFALRNSVELYPYRWSYSDEMITSENTLKITRTFFNERDNNVNGLTVARIVDKFVEDLNYEAKQRSINKKEEVLNRHMEMFPEYPADITEWLNEEIFGGYILTEKIANGKKLGVCTRCGKKVKLDKTVKHKQQTVCPKCGHKVTVFEKRYIGTKIEKAKIYIAHKVEGQLLIRRADARREWKVETDGKVTPYIYLRDRFRILYLNQNEKNKIHCYDYKFTYPWGEYWRKQKYMDVEEGYVYTRNLTEVFGDKYYNVNLAADLKKNTYPISFVSLLDNLKNIPQTEYLVKMGMYKLASELKTRDLSEGASFGKILGVNPQYRGLYSKYNVSLIEHKLIKSVREFVHEEDFIKARKLNLNFYDERVAERLLQTMTFKRFTCYFTKQRNIHRKEKIGHLMNWYEDYIQMSEQMEINLSHKGARFPKDIKTAHDRLLKEFKAVEMQKYDEQLRQASENLYRGLTEYKADGYAIVFPRTRSEFIAEGQALSHCVGTQEMYFNNHMKAEKMIFFIRRADDITVPFVTMQVDMHKCYIIQIYGYGDKAPAQEVKNFANKFVNQLKKRNREEMKSAS